MVKHWSILQINKFLNELGYRHSIKREHILKVLFKEPLDALGIKSLILEKYNINISLTTIYKQLATLEKIDVVYSEKDEFSEKKIYKLKRTSKQNTLVCLTCKRIIEVNTACVDDLVKNMSNKRNFLVLEYSLNLYGYCKECNNGSKITSGK